MTWNRSAAASSPWRPRPLVAGPQRHTIVALCFLQASRGEAAPSNVPQRRCPDVSSRHSARLLEQMRLPLAPMPARSSPGRRDMLPCPRAYLVHVPDEVLQHANHGDCGR
ncbi:hypothetical protein ACP70R_041021 [Stipagrostis hirtigluma subsp. patula]